MKKTALLLPFAAIALLGAAPSSCTPEPSTDQAQRVAQEKTIQEANAQVGMPEIVNFQEKRMMKTLYELRDSSVGTHTYIVNAMQGCLVYLGASVGYGMPYATQYSNPQKIVQEYSQSLGRFRKPSPMACSCPLMLTALGSC